MIPEHERPWVIRRVPQTLAARRISANLTDNMSGARPTTPRRSLPHRGTFKRTLSKGDARQNWRTNY